MKREKKMQNRDTDGDTSVEVTTSGDQENYPGPRWAIRGYRYLT